MHLAAIQSVLITAAVPSGDASRHLNNAAICWVLLALTETAKADNKRYPEQEEPGDSTSSDRQLAVESSRFLRYARGYLTKCRHTAYASEVAEAFRPLVSSPPFIIGLYSISWFYVAMDILYHGTREILRGSRAPRICRAIVHATVFQCIASMAIPIYSIHGIVHGLDSVCKRCLNGNFRSWLPTSVAMLAVPPIPKLVDPPAEHAIDFLFDRLWPQRKQHHQTESHNPDHDKEKTH